MDVEEIIINLKILQKLEKNQKLITRGAYLNVETTSLIPECLRRWNRQDNRAETLKKINTIVNAAIELDGIINLKETYSTCCQTCARLDIILDKINGIV
jgi:hypothetical protein